MQPRYAGGTLLFVLAALMTFTMFILNALGLTSIPVIVVLLPLLAVLVPVVLFFFILMLLIFVTVGVDSGKINRK